jgi:hypothetical protein
MVLWKPSAGPAISEDTICSNSYRSNGRSETDSQNWVEWVSHNKTDAALLSKGTVGSSFKAMVTLHPYLADILHC